MTAIDHRIAVRRHTVREAGARRRLGQVIVVIGFFVVVALIVLLFKSPLMAIREIEVTGSDHSNVTAVLDRHNVAPGVPTISVRAGALVADVEADPWVARARATITWPGTVVLTVLEHEPIAWVEIGDDWYRASATGAVLEQTNPTKRGARIRLGGLSAMPGETLTGRRVTAALEFLAMLPQELRRRALVTSGGDGTLVARIAGHLVDLGSPVEMREKAAALTAILAGGVTDRAAISLVSPVRPAIRNPQQAVEG
jgi:cell division protein FtsQ